MQNERQQKQNKNKTELILLTKKDKESAFVAFCFLRTTMKSKLGSV